MSDYCLSLFVSQTPTMGCENETFVDIAPCAYIDYNPAVHIILSIS